MPVNRHAKVDSSNIESLGYDLGAKVMEIIFKTDAQTIYRYPNVDAKTFCELFNAESVGSHFSKNLRKSLKTFDKIRKGE